MTLAFKIKQEAVRLGFEACGFAKAARLETEARYLEHWLRRKAHGTMRYLENYFEERIDPTRLLPGAKTVICVIKNYFPGAENRQLAEAPQVSWYAYGKDYHQVLKSKLFELLARIREWVGDSVAGRVCTDSAPILEKVWAERAGIGWRGKHTNVIRKRVGSFFFLGELILDIELPEYDTPAADHCGRCRKCIEACPTQALTAYEIDASRCISYLTIENKTAIEDHFRGSPLAGYIFGCDICQQVCPWNSFAVPHRTPEFNISTFIQQANWQQWLSLNNSQFKKLFQHSAFRRIRFQKLRDNLTAAAAAVTRADGLNID
jgi:epoxyqueuosine reductase